MCILCLEIQKGLTAREIAYAYREFVPDTEEHHSEILENIIEHSDPLEVLKEMEKIIQQEE